MDLKEIRTKLVDQSGRFDLVVDTTDYVDAGANYWIKEAQKYLDMRFDNPKEELEQQITLTSGSYFFDFPATRFRAFREVRIQDSSRTEMYKLEPLPLDELRNRYGDTVQSFSMIDPSRPSYWSVAIFRNRTPNSYEQVNYRVFFLAPADQDYDVFVSGLSYSPFLEADQDVNYWSELFPQVLINASLMMIYQTLGQLTAYQTYKAYVDEFLQLIDFDVVEQQLAILPDNMLDSWRYLYEPRLSPSTIVA